MAEEHQNTGVWRLQQAVAVVTRRVPGTSDAVEQPVNSTTSPSFPYSALANINKLIRK
ncbi:hypothetical protein J6590_040007 [Homalodisca vitripennis]|nr:hypothetical protein J6590_040007 [Homalodisca vitripennis]